MSRLDEYNERRRLEAGRKQRRTRVVKRAKKRTGTGRIGPDAYDAKIAEKPCRVCGSGPVDAHHIVPRSQWPKDRPGKNGPDNLMPLCRTCHQHHHTTAHRRVPRHVLEPAEIALVVAVKGESWASKWYPTTIGRTA